jgi:hypothetical protein
MTATCQRCVATAGDDDDLAFAVCFPAPSEDDCTGDDFSLMMLQDGDQSSSATASCQRCVKLVEDTENGWTGCFPAYAGPSEDDCTDADYGFMAQEQISSVTATCQRCLVAVGGGDEGGGGDGICAAAESCAAESTDDAGVSQGCFDAVGDYAEGFAACGSCSPVIESSATVCAACEAEIGAALALCGDQGGDDLPPPPDCIAAQLQHYIDGDDMAGMMAFVCGDQAQVDASTCDEDSLATIAGVCAGQQGGGGDGQGGGGGQGGGDDDDDDDAWMACIPAPSEDDCTVEDFGLIIQGDEYFTQTTARCQFCLGANDGIENGWTGCFPAGTSCSSDETTLGEGCLMGACEDEAPPDGIGSACMLCLAKASGDLDAVTQAHLDSCEADETAATDDIDPAPENSVVAQLTLDIEMPAAAELDAFKGSFSADVAATLDGVSADDVVITSVTSGSVVVDFYIAPAADGTALVSADAMTTALAADVSIAGATLTADSVTSAPTVAPAPGGDEDEELLPKSSRASAIGASAVAVLIVAAVL